MEFHEWVVLGVGIYLVVGNLIGWREEIAEKRTRKALTGSEFPRFRWDDDGAK